jgi:hypothetical protein
MYILCYRKNEGSTILPPEPIVPEVPGNSDLVSLGILSKPISEFTNADIGTIVSIPYTDSSGNITGPIEFEVVGVNHHKSIDDESKPTITLMSKNVLRHAAFDAKEPNNPDSNRVDYGNNRWSVSNIRQWLNSSGAANEWFTPQHEYDATPDTTNVDSVVGAYADDPGFLAGFSDDVKQHFATVSNVTLLSDSDGSGTETTQDKVFLPSYTEMNFGNKNSSYPEGTALSRKFTNNSSRIKSYNGRDDSYWMRTPFMFLVCFVEVRLRREQQSFQSVSASPHF